MLHEYDYRAFDKRYICYNQCLFDRGCSRFDLMKHMFYPNYSINTPRQVFGAAFKHVLISKRLTDINLLQSANGQGHFPLYLYLKTDNQELLETKQKRIPNLNDAIIGQISRRIDLSFTPEKEDSKDLFAPIDILDYIYAVLHSPTYRETYKEFLKIDFPRVPYPKDQKTFWQLVELGGELRQLHLLEHPKVSQFITTYPAHGDNVITRRITKKEYEQPEGSQTGKVWINDQQYFDHVPQVAWEFYIGGYQPAQKWLKDRRGRTLEFDDILHYQKIIVALTETDRIMQEIDQVDFLD